MQKKNTTRDGRATRIPAEPEAEQIAVLLDDDAATQGQRDIIATTLRELSEATGVQLPKQDEDLRDFYVEAGYSLGAANPRWRMREILKLIVAGEKFDDYKEDDPLCMWQTKRRCRLSSVTTSTASELERRLNDRKTPLDYRAALKRALRAFCEVTGSQYKAQDPAWSYAEAPAESAKFSVTVYHGGWEAACDTRSNILGLLQGIQKRVPLAKVSLRAVRGLDRTEQEEEAPAKINTLRSALRLLEEHGGEESESAVFDLKKKIHKLEHADRTPDDEWPDWIPG